MIIGYTTIPLQVQSIPPRAVVQSIYATARNPYSGEEQRVQVLEVRLCDIWAGHQPPEKYADVIASGAILGYSVPAASLKNITAFVAWESL